MISGTDRSKINSTRLNRKVTEDLQMGLSDINLQPFTNIAL